MANGRLLKQLIKFGSEGDIEAFRSISEQIILEEREKQHHLLADDLEEVLHQKPVKTRNNTSDIPFDKERGLPLIELREPKKTFDDIIISNANFDLINNILLQHHRSDLLRSHGLFPVNKILFFGPPGCGKTLAAEVIASELRYYLGIVRIDSLISSYLGETANNLRTIFEFANKRPIVLLFDEFDSISRSREDSNEHGEMKRVVNGVLQMMDSYNGTSLLIAATNHEKVLDSAIWRRFEEILTFTLPSENQIVKLLEKRLLFMSHSINLNELAKQLKGLSFADIDRIIIRSIKYLVINRKKELTIDMIKYSVDVEKNRPI